RKLRLVSLGAGCAARPSATNHSVFAIARGGRAMIEALESALQYAGRGWSVLPCRDKVPLVRGGVHAATRDLATIEWWHTRPQANVAIACGAPSGMVYVVRAFRTVGLAI